MTDSYSLCCERILNYWEKAQHPNHPLTITHSAEIQSPICGDNVYAEANIQDGVCVELGFWPRGCCICDACCEIFREAFTGKTISYIETLTEDDLRNLIGVDVPENRRYCASMGWRALKELKPHIPRQLV